MKKIVDIKNGKKDVVFNKYKLNGQEFCPECGRQLDTNDHALLEEIGKRSCKKCGAILEK